MENEDTKKKEIDDSTPKRRHKVRISLVVLLLHELTMSSSYVFFSFLIQAGLKFQPKILPKKAPKTIPKV